MHDGFAAGKRGRERIDVPHVEDDVGILQVDANDIVIARKVRAERPPDRAGRTRDGDFHGVILSLSKDGRASRDNSYAEQLEDLVLAGDDVGVRQRLHDGPVVDDVVAIGDARREA